MYGEKIDERIELYKLILINIDSWNSIHKLYFQKVFNVNLLTAYIKMWI